MWSADARVFSRAPSPLLKKALGTRLSLLFDLISKYTKHETLAPSLKIASIIPESHRVPTRWPKNPSTLGRRLNITSKAQEIKVFVSFSPQFQRGRTIWTGVECNLALLWAHYRTKFHEASTLHSPKITPASTFLLILFSCATSFLTIPWYDIIPMTVSVPIDASPVRQLMIASHMHTAGVSPVLAKSTVL